MYDGQAGEVTYGPGDGETKTARPVHRPIPASLSISRTEEEERELLALSSLSEEAILRRGRVEVAPVLRAPKPAPPPIAGRQYRLILPVAGELQLRPVRAPEE